MWCDCSLCTLAISLQVNIWWGHILINPLIPQEAHYRLKYLSHKGHWMQPPSEQHGSAGCALLTVQFCLSPRIIVWLTGSCDSLPHSALYENTGLIRQLRKAQNWILKYNSCECVFCTILNSRNCKTTHCWGPSVGKLEITPTHRSSSFGSLTEYKSQSDAK